MGNNQAQSRTTKISCEIVSQTLSPILACRSFGWRLLTHRTPRSSGIIIHFRLSRINELTELKWWLILSHFEVLKRNELVS